MDILTMLVANYGYFGVFAVSLIGSATIIFPVPTFLIIVGAGAVLNPFAVAIAAGIGAAFGELTGYGVGLGGGALVKNRKWNKYFKMTKKWFRNHSGFVIVFVYAATPLPSDVIGIFCGIIKYDLKKFFIATLIGKIVLYMVLAYSGYFGIGFLVDVIG